MPNLSELKRARNEEVVAAKRILVADVRVGTREFCTSPRLEVRLVDYIDQLYSYAIALTRNRDEAEDLVQETYVRALRGPNELRPDSNLKAWLFTILRNIWLNRIRLQNASPQTIELDVGDRVDYLPVDKSKDPLAQYVSRHDQQRLRTAILQLPREFREVVILREYEEMSYAEIADLQGCPVGTVMSRLARARKKLRRHFQ